MISYGRQFLDKKDIISVSKTLSSNWITQGPSVERFELALKKNLVQIIAVLLPMEQPHYTWQACLWGGKKEI